MCGSAQAVESSIVGYTSTDIQGTDSSGNVLWYQLAVQFKGVGGSVDQISVSDAFKGTGLIPGTWSGKNDAPTVQVYNGSGYDKYYFISDVYLNADDKKAKTNPQTGWANKKQLIATEDYLKCGDAVWFTAKNLGTESATITVAGEVSSASSVDIVLTGNEWQMAANPFPSAVAVNSIVTTGVTAGTWSGKNSAPTIQIYNGSGYEKFYYISDAYANADDKKAKTNQQTGWANKKQLLANEDMIGAGVGFWFQNNTLETGKLSFSLSK